LGFIVGSVNFSWAQSVSLLAGDPASPGTTGATNGIGTVARFNNPFGVVTDGAGNLYVADITNNEIRKIVIASKTVSLLAGSTATTAGHADGTGTTATFNAPIGLAMDGSGNLYVADYMNNEIRQVVVATGVVTTFAGATSSGSVNGVGTAARFNQPRGIAYDGAGSLYVTDYVNNEIRKIDIATATVSTFAGTTAIGSTDATGTAARFDNPYGICYSSGNLYVTDYNNYTIRKIVVASAAVTTLAGFPGAQGTINGAGTNAQFNDPKGIATNGSGTLYVTDQASDLIRSIVISTGSVNNYIGSLSTQGNTNGPATAALFNYPGGITFDNSGNMFIGDQLNNEIREVTGIPLPIELEYFKATNEENEVLLKWATATETNNQYFTVERTTDMSNWETIDQIPAAGNSIYTKYYNAVDEKPISGISYYRLKQTDYNGSSSYSDVILVNRVADIKALILAGNPVSSKGAILFQSSSPGNAQLTIYDALGRLVSTANLTLYQGANNIPADFSAYSNGIYFIHLNSSGEDYTTKCVVSHL
jgi:hypothetical protein